LSVSIELEIRKLLEEKNSFDAISAQLVVKFETSEIEWNEPNLNALYNFLLRTCQPQILIEFILKNFKNKDYIVPWGHFIEAVHQLYDEINPELIKLFKKGLKETDGKYQACRSFHWDPLIGDMAEWRSQKKWEFSKKAPLMKKALLEKLFTLRTQQLYEAEKNLLKRLQKMFPGDPDVLVELRDAKERYAYEVLNRYTGMISKEITFDESHESSVRNIIAQAFFEAAQKNPEMSLDCAVAVTILEDFEVAYQILQFAEFDLSHLWLKTELQLKTRRYIELLDDLNRIEMTLSEDPETFFATALLRAEALWGLGQKHTAMEILETLLASRPNYRAASVLLNLWRGI